MSHQSTSPTRTEQPALVIAGQRTRVVVVGGGPAGLMAAGQAALAGAEVVLVEKMERTGKKLLLTGNGRCNVTNRSPIHEYIRHFHTDNPSFIKKVFSRFFHHDLVHFLKRLNLDTVVEDHNRVFPAAGQAKAVASVLESWVRSTGVSVIEHSRAVKVITQDDRATGILVESSGRQPPVERHADAVIIATGGASYPQTGSSGDGYGLARAVGHTVVPHRPALVPITVAAPFIKDLQGLSLSDVKLRLFVGGRKVADASGDVLFTHYGLSGPAILSLSNAIGAALAARSGPEVSMDLVPGLDEQELDRKLLALLDAEGSRQFGTLMHALLPRRLVPVCASQVGIALDKAAHQISSSERKRLKVWLKGLKIVPSGHLSFAEAMVTAGGVALSEVDPVTMESALVRGLYFAGEVLDIDADTGGYNLQAAFSTGWIAGRAAAAA